MSFHLRRGIPVPDSQRYPLNHQLINYVEDIIVFLKSVKFITISTIVMKQKSLIHSLAKPQLTIINLQIENYEHLMHSCEDNALESTVVQGVPINMGIK